ncbi:MAG: hypothetical protein ACODAG_04275 [Myxococcota bacterium]
MDLPDLPAWLDHALGYAMLLFTLTTLLHGGIGIVLPILGRLAAQTSWKGDDRAHRWLRRVYDGMGAFLDVVRRLLPRLTVDAAARRRGGGAGRAAVLVLAVGMGASVVTGCGGTTDGLQRHASASVLLDETAHTAHDAMMEARQERLEHAVERAESAEEARQAAGEIRAAWERAVSLYDSLAETIDSYQVGVLAGVVSGDIDLSTITRLLRQVYELYDAWRAALSSLGVQIPGPPDLSMLGGDS